MALMTAALNPYQTGQMAATTGRKKPIGLADYYKNYASQYLTPYYSLKADKDAEANRMAFEKETADKTAALKEKEMSLYAQSEADQLTQARDIAEKNRLSSEAFAKKEREMTSAATDAQRAYQKKQDTISNVISGAGLAVSGASALSDMGYDVVGGIGGILKSGLKAISGWFS